VQPTLRAATLADAVLPRPTRVPAYARDAILIVGFSLVNALAAQVEVRLPFTPVPITGQTFAVLLTGLLLGGRLGGLALIAYLAEGLVGLPFFAGGKSGLAYALGPTGGYLVGFVVAAYVVGRLADRGWDRRVGTTLLAMIIGNLIIYAAGLAWLVRFVGPDRVLALGLVPFLAGDLVKVILAAIALPGGWKLVGRRGAL
jgi:biotin transport system substrate-specific component